MRDPFFECSVTRAISAAPDWFVVRRLFERWQGRLNAPQLAAMLCRLASLAGATHQRMLRSEAGALRQFMAALLLEARAALPAADARTATAMLRGMALLQQAGKVRVDGTLISDVLFYTAPTLKDLRAPDLGNLLWSLAQLGHAPADSWMERLYRDAEPLLERLERDEVPLVLYSLARLQAVLPPRWRAALTDAAQDDLASLRQPQLSMLLQALGAARSRGGSPDFLDALLEEFGGRLDQLGPQALTTCVWALARLRHVPGRSWLGSFFAASFRLLPSYRTQELAVTLWALARLRLYPGDLWLDEFFDTSEGLLDPQRGSAGSKGGGSGGGGSGGGGQEAAVVGFSTLDLAMTGYALAQLGLRPPKSWARRYCAAVLRHKRELTKPLLRQVLVALGSFRIGNLDGWRTELYSAAGLKLTRRLRGRRGSKRPRLPMVVPSPAAALPLRGQQQQQPQPPPQQQQQQQPQLNEWKGGPAPAASGLRLILDARRSPGGSTGQCPINSDEGLP